MVTALVLIKTERTMVNEVGEALSSSPAESWRWTGS